MRNFPYRLASVIGACLATFALTVAASAPATAAGIVVGAAA